MLSCFNKCQISARHPNGKLLLVSVLRFKRSEEHATRRWLHPDPSLRQMSPMLKWHPHHLQQSRQQHPHHSKEQLWSTQLYSRL